MVAYGKINSRLSPEHRSHQGFEDNGVEMIRVDGSPYAQDMIEVADLDRVRLAKQKREWM